MSAGAGAGSGAGMACWLDIREGVLAKPEAPVSTIHQDALTMHANEMYARCILHMLDARCMLDVFGMYIRYIPYACPICFPTRCTEKQQYVSHVTCILGKPFWCSGIGTGLV